MSGERILSNQESVGCKRLNREVFADGEQRISWEIFLEAEGKRVTKGEVVSLGMGSVSSLSQDELRGPSDCSLSGLRC